MPGRPQVMMLPDGSRLHLNHGPIDLVISANSEVRGEVFALATARFKTVLDELASELELLHRPVSANSPKGIIAQAMWRATYPLRASYITPMAAVAGAVADEILSSVSSIPDLTKAYVNNGGDVAFYLTAGESVTAAMVGGTITVDAFDPFRGIATSGWQGRSHSLGIADTVSVVAKNAAIADAAATMIANAVNLPDHPAITRRSAHELFPNSDLGEKLVTTGVGYLNPAETCEALAKGVSYTSGLKQKGLIAGACISLNKTYCTVGDTFHINTPNTEQTYA